MGASNQTYNTFPSAFGTGTLIPQSRSRVTALDCKPPSIHDLHCPTTVLLQSSLCSSRIHCFRNSSCLPNGRYQCVVFFLTGGWPLKVLTGLINSSGLRVLPQFSH